MSCFSDCSIKSIEYGGGIGSYLFYAYVLDCYNNGRIVGSGKTSTIGGIYGYGYCEVYSCYNSGDIILQLADKNDTSAAYVGGLVGRTINNLSIVNCYNYGSITSINDNANKYIGGIIGSSVSGKYNIRNCCNFGKLNYGDATVGALCGDINKESEWEKCYYLRNENINNIDAFGKIPSNSTAKFNMIAYFDSLESTNFVYLNDTTEETSYSGDLIAKLNKYSSSKTSSAYRVYYKWGIDDKTGNVVFIKE